MVDEDAWEVDDQGEKAEVEDEEGWVEDEPARSSMSLCDALSERRASDPFF